MAEFEITIDSKLIQDLFLNDRGIEELAEVVLNQVLESEMTEHLQADRYEHTDGRQGQRNGHYTRKMTSRVGTLNLRVPRDRDGSFSTAMFGRLQRNEKALVLALMEMVLNGVSTRRVQNITDELCGHRFKKSTVSDLCKGLNEQVEAWCERPLADEYPFVLVDAMHTKVRRQGAVRSTGALIIIGINSMGYREILGVRIADNRAPIARQRDLDGLQLDAHALAGLRWQPIESVQIDAGARLDLIHVDITDRLNADAQSDERILVASPRITGRWQPLDFWQLFAAYGRGFRPPEARSFSSFKPQQTGIGDEIYMGGEPQATVSDVFEVGTRWDPADWFGASVAGFATVIERESIFDHVSGINLELNGTRRLGAELVLYSDPLPWLSLRGDLTYVDAHFTASQNPVPLAPWLTGGLRAIITHHSGPAPRPAPSRF